MSSDNTILRTVVDLGDRSYEVCTGEGILGQVGYMMRQHNLNGTVAVISNPAVLDLYHDEVASSLDDHGLRSVFLSIREGETHKNLDTVRHLYEELLENSIERGDSIIALGGGQTGDIAGFVAATLLRGFDFVQDPTTVLAQVDAAIGGKVGVNLPLGKNLVGAFYQPRFVLSDVATLMSLPEREFRSGIAEIIKYACIRDREFFVYLEENLESLLARESRTMLHAISVSCGIKAEVVGQDELELTGVRSILNFGHTIGHAIESLTGYRRFLHGEAVAAGMVAAGHMGTAVTGFPGEELDRLVALERVADFSFDLGDLSPDDILDRVRFDKKVEGGRVRYVLPRRLGEVIPRTTVPEPVVHDALDYVWALT